jgi:predicted dehydrogenase
MAFRVCVIGCGSLSTSAHGPSLRRYADRHEDVVLAGCCDLDAAKTEAYRIAFGFERGYTDYQRMLQAEEPAAVCLMAPVDKTCELSCAVLGLGFPLLMEKPPGLNRAECLAMVAAAEKAGVPNQVSFNRRYAPLVGELKTRLDSQFQPDDIQDLRYDFYRINRRDADFATTAIHAIDTVRFLAGAPYRRVRFRYQGFPALGPTVANIFLECDMASGASAHITFCPVTGVIIERAAVSLFDHTFFLNIPIWRAFDCPGRLQHLVRGELTEDIDGGTLEGAAEMYIASGFYGENASFLDDLRAGRRPEGDIRSGLQSVEIADAMRQRLPEYVTP